MQLYVQFERPLTEADLDRLRPLVRRRGQREPLQYIVGSVDFFGLKLKVDRRALIPRPETERLVELLIERFPSAPAQILDLGTGTGAIALALATAWPEAKVTAVDLSAAALELARENAAAAALAERVTWLESDWFARLPAGHRYDLIVANPPYLSAEETAQAAPEVRDFEPGSALTSGEAGLADAAAILAGARAWLNPGGSLALETGIDHHAELKARASALGWTQVESRQDLTGRDRYFIAS